MRKDFRRLLPIISFLTLLVVAAGPLAWHKVESAQPSGGRLLGGMVPARFVGFFQEAGPTVSLEKDQYVIAENSKTLLIVVNLSEVSAEPVSVSAKTQQVTATANFDYGAFGEAGKPARVVTFAPGVKTAVIAVDIFSDQFTEGTETFSVVLDSPQKCSLGSPASAAVTILDQPPGDPLYNIQLASTKPAICAGGKNSPAHQTTITATLLDPGTGMPVMKSGVTVTFSTTAGSVSPAAAATDAGGKATTTLTSNNTASSATAKYNATVTAQAQGNPATVQVEFQAPQLTLTAAPAEINIGDTAMLTLQAKWDVYPVDQHALSWYIAKVWDADGILIYDGVGEPPSGYGYIFDAPSATDANGMASATWRGTSPGTVRLEARDEDVVFLGGAEKPKATSGDIKTKGDPTGKSGLVDIYNGQNGAKVPDDKESTLGAFTVANLNDTNGDGIPDNDPVKNKSVKATKLGRDEVDLMALVIHPQKPVENEKIKLTLVKGAAKFWKEKTKEVEVTATEFTPDNKGLTLWVEATDVSKTVRDIEIKVEYNGASNVVKATAVWATMTAVAHDNKKAQDLLDLDPWKDLTTPPKNFLLLDGFVGLVPITKTSGVRNTIYIQFTLSPAGIGKEPGVSFDVTRQLEGKSWAKIDGDFYEVEKKAKPAFTTQRVETPNDDPNDLDESKEPTETNHFYSHDGPGDQESAAIEGVDNLVMRYNAKEFVRVRFDGKRPTGNVEIGSRSSDYYLWHFRHWLNVKDKLWVRSTGDEKESKQNDIGDTHKTIGTSP